MLNLKKGLALVLAAATAFTFAPVANLGAPVQAEAANGAEQAISINASNNTVTGQAYTVQSDEAGNYTVVANDKSAWKALNVTANKTNSGSNSSSTVALNAGANDASRTISGSVAVGDSLSLTFADAGVGANGNYKFDIIYVGDGSKQTAKTVKTYNITLSESHNSSVTAGAVTSIKLFENNSTPGSELYTTSKDAYQNVKPSEVEYNKTYQVTLTSANATVSGGSTVQTYADFSVAGNSVEIAKTATVTGGTAVTTKFNSVSNGTSTITANWKTANAVTLANGTHYDKDATFATTSFTVKVKDQDTTVVQYTGSDNKTHTVAAGASATPAIAIDTLVNTTSKINVTSDKTVTYVSTKPSVATVSSDGTVTAVAYGSANIIVYAGDSTYTIPVNVSDVATDNITVKYNGNTVDDANQVDLDPSTSTAANAVKSAKLDINSAAGLAYTVSVVANTSSTTPIVSDIISVAQDGTVTAGSKTGTAYIYIKSTTAGKKNGNHKYVKVVVNAKPAADVTVSDVTLDLKNNNTKDIDVVTPGLKNPTIYYYVTTTKDANGNTDESADIVTRLGKTLKAVKYGKATLRVEVLETATTRKTVKTAKIYVLSDASKSASDLKVASSALTLAVGKTASAGASTSASGAAITYASDNEKVATVAADGTITAVAPGTAVVTVKAAETDTVNAGVATIVVTVPQNPAKVAGLKVANKKGAKVSVSWKSQGKNINYRVYKKVGNGSWKAKNVAGNKTTLLVKKGAKVTVKVKAYAKDVNGKTTWGPKATKKTFKTDKK